MSFHYYELDGIFVLQREWACSPLEMKHSFMNLSNLRNLLVRRPAISAICGMALGLFLTSCSAGKGGPAAGSGQIQVNGNLGSCPGDSMRLYKIVGPLREQIASTPLLNDEQETTFEMLANIDSPGLYALGPNARAAGVFVLGDVPLSELTGNCQNPAQSFALTGSPANDAYQNMVKRAVAHNKQMQQVQQRMQMAQQTNPGQMAGLQQEMQQENTRYFAFLDSMLTRSDYAGKVATLYNFRPFGSQPEHSSYANELDYFKDAFFKGVDLSDADIVSAPQTFEKAQFYAGTLSSYFPPEASKASLDQLLAGTQVGTTGHEVLLKGFLNGLEQRKSDLYVTYGEAFLQQYGSDPIASQIQARVNQIKALMVGNTAPEIEQPTPEGQTLKLTDLRGQYVMIDFWASWCRPCRMENPNVVRAYNKYRKSGFEILGVSLDKDKNKWVQAIQQDGLTWKHVSDLGGWSARPAADYGISSIPATLLLDREGKILAKNLRGPALEAKLQELFGF